MSPPLPPPCLDLPGHLAGLLSSARSWLLAFLCVFYIPGQTDTLPSLHFLMIELCRQESSDWFTPPLVAVLSSLLTGCLTSS